MNSFFKKFIGLLWGGKKTKEKKISKKEIPVRQERRRYVSNKEKRNEWLSSKGYTPKEVVQIEKFKPTVLSRYATNVATFKRLKEKNKIRIFFEKNIIIDKNKVRLQRNKQGIPIYTVKKTQPLAFD